MSKSRKRRDPSATPSTASGTPDAASSITPSDAIPDTAEAALHVPTPEPMVPVSTVDASMPPAAPEPALHTALPDQPLLAEPAAQSPIAEPALEPQAHLAEPAPPTRDGDEPEAKQTELLRQDAGPMQPTRLRTDSSRYRNAVPAEEPMPEQKRHVPVPEHAATIKVIGIGGGGCNAVNRMVEAGLSGVDFFAVNTDVQALRKCRTANTVHIGQTLTRGLGAGANPNLGRESADESREDLAMVLEGADLVFITAGMGGGTGTGAAPVIAELARESGALTVAVVTKPFAFEGRRRMQVAERGITDLEQKVDTLITIPNERILQIIEKRTPLEEAFAYADDVLRQGIQGISDLITQPGLINLDFADVKAIMTDAGSAMMGIGEGKGEHRAADAAQKAIASPLLETTIEGARGVIFNITGGSDLSMFEVNEAAEMIARAVDSEAQIIFGAQIDPALQEKVRITVLAAGFGPPRQRQQSTPGVAFSTGDLEKVAPVNMEDIDVPAFLRYRS